MACPAHLFKLSNKFKLFLRLIFARWGWAFLVGLVTFLQLHSPFKFMNIPFTFLNQINFSSSLLWWTCLVLVYTRESTIKGGIINPWHARVHYKIKRVFWKIEELLIQCWSLLYSSSGEDNLSWKHFFGKLKVPRV